jgi:hypothetical protein
MPFLTQHGGACVTLPPRRGATAPTASMQLLDHPYTDMCCACRRSISQQLQRGMISSTATPKMRRREGMEFWSCLEMRSFYQNLAVNLHKCRRRHRWMPHRLQTLPLQCLRCTLRVYLPRQRPLHQVSISTSGRRLCECGARRVDRVRRAASAHKHPTHAAAPTLRCHLDGALACSRWYCQGVAASQKPLQPSGWSRRVASRR